MCTKLSEFVHWMSNQRNIWHLFHIKLINLYLRDYFFKSKQPVWIQCYKQKKVNYDLDVL